MIAMGGYGEGLGTFAERLKFAMQERDLRPKELAAISHVSWNSILDYRRGEKHPGFDTLAALCKALDVSADWMLGLDGNAWR